MRVLVQWATATVSDWVEYDINSMADVRAMPRKPVPADSPLIDDQPGWIAAINIQGTVLSGDHVGFAINSDGHLVAGRWNDDLADWPFPFGSVITFPPLASDPAIGGRMNTRNAGVNYADRASLEAFAADPEHGPWCSAWLAAADATPPAGWDGTLNHSGGYVELRPWSEFPKFTPNNQLHGVWLSDPLMEQHNAARSVRGWREWGAP